MSVYSRQPAVVYNKLLKEILHTLLPVQQDIIPEKDSVSYQPIYCDINLMAYCYPVVTETFTIPQNGI